MACALFYSRLPSLFAVSGIRPVYSVSHVPGLYRTPTRPFSLSVANKPLMQIDACEIAWRLGGPCVALGWPLGSQG